MSDCCSTSIDEERHARLKALADSINETARMARATMALLLTVALYLGFTLLSSTDENLLLNAQVAVLQVGSGMALDKSYIFGPPIFLYLHVQGLFLLSVLYRKIRRFETALDRELSGTRNSPRLRQEYWSLLSAFAFVQLFRQGGHFPYVSKLLAWISIEAIPLSLLFIIDLSFVRYQSEWITKSHHIVLSLDLVSVIWFNLVVFGRCTRSIWTSLRVVVWTWGRWMLAGSMTLLLWLQAHPPSFNIESVERMAKKKKEENKAMSAQEVLDMELKKQRNRIWRTDDDEITDETYGNTVDEKTWQSESFWDFMSKMWQHEEFRQAVWRAIREEDMNMIDIGPCEWWGYCRYLSVRNLWLVSIRPTDVFVPKIDGYHEADFDFVQWSDLNKLSLAGRNLRFADFRFAQLQGTNMEGAQLQGANLERANLRDVNLVKAKMDGAFLSAAELQHADLSEAELQSANLHRAMLQRASLNRTRLWSTNLSSAQLQRAYLTDAELLGANLHSAQMDGASLWDAKLEGTNFQEALLRGASFARSTSHAKEELLGINFKDAKLKGANLRNVKLLGVNLMGAQLEGVDLGGAEIRCSFGEPGSWELAWMRGASIKGSECSNEDFDTPDKNYESEIVLWWNGGKNQKIGSLSDYVNDIPEMSKDDWLSETDLDKEKWIIFDGIVTPSPHTDDPPHNCRDLVTNSRYWKAWAKWMMGLNKSTVDFACKNGYTGYSSVRRWSSENPLSDMEQCVRPKKILDENKKHILRELEKASRNNGKCPGLRVAPDGVWFVSDGEWREAWKVGD